MENTVSNAASPAGSSSIRSGANQNGVSGVKRFTARYCIRNNTVGSMPSTWAAPATGHPPAVVTAAAAHVQHPPPAQIGQVRRHPLPLPVGAPLGIDVRTEEFKRPLAPGHQPAQGRVQGLGVHRPRLTDSDPVPVQPAGRRPRRQRRHGVVPARQIAVRLVQQTMAGQRRHLRTALAQQRRQRRVQFIQIGIQHGADYPGAGPRHKGRCGSEDWPVWTRHSPGKQALCAHSHCPM